MDQVVDEALATGLLDDLLVAQGSEDWFLPDDEAPTAATAAQPQGQQGGKRKRSSSGKAAGGKAVAGGKAFSTDPAQLEAQRRWREKQKSLAQELQAELQTKAAQAEQLSSTNAALKRKQELLQAVLTVREDQLRVLHHDQHARLQLQPAASAGPGSSKQDDGDGRPSNDRSAGATPSDPAPPALAPGTQLHSDSAAAEAQQQQQHDTLALLPADAPEAAVATFATAPAPGEPLPSLRRIPPYHTWGEAWIARMRTVTPREWQALWVEFVKEVSVYVISAEAHGPGSMAHDALTQAVSHYLGVLDRITLFRPTVYHQSLEVNLVTGERQPVPPGHWAVVARAVNTTPAQVRECMTALEVYEGLMQPVIQERVELMSNLTQQLPAPAPPASTSALPAPPRPPAPHPVVGAQAAALPPDANLQGMMAGQVEAGGQLPGSSSLQGPGAAASTAAECGNLDAPVNADVSALPSQAAAPAAGAAAAEAGSALATSLASSRGGAAAGSVEHQRRSRDPGDLVQLLSSNVAKELSAHNVVSDFLCTRVLSVVQLAQAAAVSWPWLPDVTAILREGMAAAGGTAAIEGPSHGS